MKRVLLIGLKYHTYTDAIIDEMRRQGCDVVYHDIQPRDVVMKTLRILAPAVYVSRLHAAHVRILETERKSRYDLVVFIQAHQMSVATLGELRSALSPARFVLYNWDALTNHDYRPQLPFFDDVFTFDRADAECLGVRYLPLFCVPDFQALQRRMQHERAVYFVGNIVSVARYEAIQAFKRYCVREGIVFRAYLACTPLVLFRLLRRGYFPLDVSLGPIEHRKFIELIESSIAVFDFANHQQSGYTMRTIENLCAGKKIITSNPHIKQEHFFSDNRIHVFHDMDFSGIREFLSVPLRDPDERFEPFHISTFVRTLTFGTSVSA